MTPDEVQVWTRRAARERLEADKIEWRRKQAESDARYRNKLVAQQLAERRQKQDDFIGFCLMVTVLFILPTYVYLLKLWWLS